VAQRPARFDAWDPPQSRLEAHAFALFAARRALTQTLVGLTDAQLWAPGRDGRSPGAIARAAWDREFHWLWPPDMDAPPLPATPSLVEALYALVRHRAVSEELLMAASDADLERPHLSRATRDAPRSLAEALRFVARAELADAERLAVDRRARDPGWAGADELLTRTRAAVADAAGG
jgi:hypothetical protein